MFPIHQIGAQEIIIHEYFQSLRSSRIDSVSREFHIPSLVEKTKGSSCSSEKSTQTPSGGQACESVAFPGNLYLIDISVDNSFHLMIILLEVSHDDEQVWYHKLPESIVGSPLGPNWILVGSQLASKD